MNCKHCSTTFSCGCQKIQASDGATVHKTCLNEYEEKLKTKK